MHSLYWLSRPMELESGRPRHEQISDWLREQIEQGRYGVDEKLPSEKELGDTFEVSRVTVREAQIALRARGLITVRSGSGARVAATPEAVGLPRVNALELTQARALFESEAAALAATRIEPHELDRLDELVGKMAEGPENSEPILLSPDKTFHLTISHASRNPVIVDTIERLWFFRTEVAEIREAYISICRVDPAARLQEHAAIAAALRRRDPLATRDAMRHHFDCILSALLDAAEQAAVDEAKQRIADKRQQYLNPSTAAD